jgi:Fe-S-cluster-containing dehydrogenase component
VPNSFIFDANRCTGCGACQLACSIENELGPERSWRRIETFNPRHHPWAPLFHLSLACNHCDEPACMYACPALAYDRDAVTGAVLLDESKCIGCQYCLWACPYDAPVFDKGLGVMSKCTFCNHLLQEGLKPACAVHCPTGALDFADLPEEQLVNGIEGFPETDLGPRIQIRPLATGRRLPVMTASSVALPVTATESSGSGISLKSEWSLMLFTSAAAALVALVAGSVKSASTINPFAFAGAAVVTMGLASLHLGRLERAYRAVLNLRRSWLSREVVTIPGFLALGSLYAFSGPSAIVLGATATLVGFLGLVCADQVYSVLRKSTPAYHHSASVVWTGFFLAGVFSGTAWLAGIFGLGKLALYVLRKLSFIDAGRPVRPIVSAARMGFGLVLPAILWLIDFQSLHVYLIAGVLIGELIDRSEYYEELESESPRREMDLDLQRQVARREPVLADLAAS